MNYYYTIFGIAVVLMGLQNVRFTFGSNNKGNESKKKGYVYLIIIFSMITALAGLRAVTVGADTRSYIREFYNIAENGIGVRGIKTEFVTAIVAWLCSRLSPEPQLYLLICASIISVFFAKFIYDNSNDVYLSTIVFIGMFFVVEMNLMRQWIAISLGLNAYTYYKRNGYWKAVLFLALAFFTHTTAIVMVVIHFIETTRNKRKIIFPVIIGSALMVMFRTQIFMISARFIPKYESYFTDSYFYNEGTFNIKNAIFVLIIGILAYILISKGKQLSEEERNEIYTFEIIMIIALAFSLCGNVLSMFHRVVYFYSVFLIIIVPKMTEHLINKRIFKCLIIISMFIMLWRSGVIDNNGISHYLWFWE